jgi:hexosaminidase
MCPTSHCYFDYYQGDPETEPEAIGGYTTLKKVYSFRPTPPVLTPEEAKHILGAQGNVWTEYIPTPEHAEYMAVPRMTALAEVVWTADSLLDWHDFKERLLVQFERFRQADVNYCEGSFKVNGLARIGDDAGDYSILLETEAPGAEIHFTTDNSEPSLASDLYQAPLQANSDMTITALAFKDGQAKGKPSVINVSYHKAIGLDFKWEQEPSYKYPGESKYSLADGLRGSDYFNDGKWIGFHGDDLDITIDFGEIVSISHIEASFLHDQRRWIFLPEKVVFYFSEDGKNYTNITRERCDFEMDVEAPFIHPIEFEFDDPVKLRYARIQAVNTGVCPDWHPGAGGKAWIFADEVVIR